VLEPSSPLKINILRDPEDEYTTWHAGGAVHNSSSYLNGEYYGSWKNRMENYIQVEDYELWMLIKNGPLIPMEVNEDDTKTHKKPEEFDSDDFKIMEKNAKAKEFLYFGLGPDEYTRIFECESAKDILKPSK